MTEPESAGWEDFPMEGDEVLIAGIEIHAQIIQVSGNQKIHFTYLPPVRDRKLPGTMTEFNTLLEELCSKTVAAFPDSGYARFHTALRKSGGADRCWYHLKITLRNDVNNPALEKITDWIDPELLHADPHVAFRAKKARAIVKRLIKEYMSTG